MDLRKLVTEGLDAEVLIARIRAARSESFTEDRLRQLQKPCVYLFLRGNKVLYVGSSRNGILRFGNANHRMAKTFFTEILVLWFNTWQYAERIEHKLISALCPPFNKSGKGKHDTAEERYPREPRLAEQQERAAT